MKKITSIVLCFVLLMASFSQTLVASYAAGTPTITCEGKECNPGDSITIDVTISNNPGITYLELTPAYSEQLGTPTITNGSLFSITKGKNLVFDADEDVSADGTLVSFTFTVGSSVEPGNYSVGFVFRSAFNYSEEAVSFTIVPATVTVKAKPVPVKGIALDQTTATVKTENTITLTPIFTPETATNKNVTWESSDIRIASVADGVVTGVKKGTATITVRSEDGGYEATCIVTVECSHTNTTCHPAEASTCIKQGHGEYYTCDACGEVTSGSDELLPLGNHVGGTATCQDKAICDVCHQPYGEYGSHSLTEHAAKDPDHFNAGNIEYWTCDVCAKYFSDADGNAEITEEETVLPIVPHSYSNEWSYDETQHWKECGCGNKIEIADHEFDNACDTTCNVCGYERTITHDYSDTWSSDETNHWHECTVCHDKKDVAPHSGGSATCVAKAVCEICNASYGDYGEHSLTHYDRVEPDHFKDGNIEYWQCGLCGAYFSDSDGNNEIAQQDTVIAKIPHSYSDEWSKDETKHWKECSCGDKIETADHEFDNSCDTTCNVCGYERTIMHDYAEAWSSDETNHWHECTVCHDKTDVAPHSGGSATCIAKAVCEICNASYGDYGEHSLTHYDRVEADHFKAGNIEYWQCGLCGAYFSDSDGNNEITQQDTVIARIPHSYSDEWSKDETKHWKECSCGDRISEENHVYDNACDTTCNVCGYERTIMHDYADVWSSDETEHWHECTVCHDKKDVAPHSGGSATCVAKAVCEICNTSYGDFAEHIYEEIVSENCLKSAATCVSPAVYYKSCSVCGAKSSETFTYGDVDNTNHVGGRYTVDQKEATCYEDGYTGDTYCSGCDALLEKGTVIDKTEHNPASVWSHDENNHWKECQTIGCGTIIDKAPHCGGTATCIAQPICDVCGVKYGVVDSNNHVHTEIRNQKDATEDEDGYTGDVYCLDCNAIVKTGEIIEKIPHTHDLMNVPAKDSTCTSEGNIQYWYCSNCQKYYSDEECLNEIELEDTVIAKKFHNFLILEHDDTNHWFKCENCDAVAGVEAHSGGTKTCKEKAICEKCLAPYGDLEHHEYVKNAEDKYLLSKATKTSPAIYYVSCAVCGEKGTDTFENGQPLPEEPSPQTGEQNTVILWISAVSLLICGTLAASVILKRRRTE